jgi:glycosyltransferase involved in cell wall biosynthesis
MRFVMSFIGMNSGGVRTAARSLIEWIFKVDEENDYLLLCPDGKGYENLPLGPRGRMELVRSHPRRPQARIYCDQVKVPALCRKFDAHALLSMCNFGPRKSACPQALAVHDAYLLHANHRVLPAGCASTAWKLKMRLRRMYFRWISGSVSRFCTLSDFMASKLSSSHAIPASKIHVIPNAVSKDLFDRPAETAGIERALAPYGGNFKLCYVAVFYPHKNHRILIDAMRRVREEHGIRDATVFTTIDPKDSAAARRFLDDVRLEGLGRSIVNLGTVELAELPALYERCDAVVMPSLLECYSISYLEGMYFGLPIIASDRDFARASCEDGALYFDPMDAGDLAAKIAMLRHVSSLSAGLAARGKRRIESIEFSWEEAARRYVAVLKEIAKAA